MEFSGLVPVISCYSRIFSQSCWKECVFELLILIYLGADFFDVKKRKQPGQSEIIRLYVVAGAAASLWRSGIAMACHFSDSPYTLFL